MKKLHVLVVSVAMMASADVAFAATGGWGETFTSLKTDLLGPSADILLGLAFVIGVVLAMVSITVLYKNSRNNHDPNARPWQQLSTR